ncbi:MULTISPECIES: efflux RND transporter periplasmic adaptor subunit [unclassified Marinobacter]|uniref:efflux RND transporter periplasmic adaptor subunit n=1 Tax=unclassified Marinobacter TaxID=83889 RepID=UPI000BF5FE6F|nr:MULTISPECIES: efflux RND transporter periplasmic adaptor subunit [unclassified Marinobacter]PFG09348.1 multidrug efflux system membrane fusion protein [Marinobacter sp. LV10MA510-1]PFG51268.1 multidrug efflux system membrane fusion protein [Marinobacter sp. LV10R520-4]
MNKFKWSSVGLSLLLVLALLIWMAGGDIKQTETKAPELSAQQGTELTRVQVTTLNARNYQPELLVQGQVLPWRSVTVSARVSATVKSLEAELGDTVTQGQTLLTLTDDGRSAERSRWQARVRKLNADLNAAQSLRSRNLASESDLLGLESELAAAKAELEMANQAIADLVAQAPFDGVVNQKSIEVGDLVQPGTALMHVVQVDRLKATAQIPQQAVHQVAEGQLVSVRLLDGDELSGRVRFLASAADTGTRSFAIEVEVDNPQQRRIAGGSANLAIALPEVSAHNLSPAFLALDNNGKPGVKHVGDDNKVVFSRVRLLSVKTDGAWVGGLPDNLRLITRGAGFVSEGEEVTAVAASNGGG